MQQDTSVARMTRAWQGKMKGAQCDSKGACLGWRGVVLGGGRIAAVALRRPGRLLRRLHTTTVNLNRQLRRASKRVTRW